MKSRKVAMVTLVAVSCALCTVASGRPAKKPLKLEGLSYPAARQLIVGYGWLPLQGECGGGASSNETCRDYPEIGNCAGTGIGLCDMTFARKDRCLLVVTVGGAPRMTRSREPVVRDVQFSPSPCTKG